MEQPGTAKNERLRVYDVVVVGRGGRISQRERKRKRIDWNRPAGALT